MLSDALLTAVREVRADLFDSRAEQTRSQALVRHIGNHRSEAFQHLRGDNCRRLGRQNQQQTTMHGTHHTTNENRQWSERRQTILVTGTTPDYYYNYNNTTTTTISTTTACTIRPTTRDSGVNAVI